MQLGAGIGKWMQKKTLPPKPESVDPTDQTWLKEIALESLFFFLDFLVFFPIFLAFGGILLSSPRILGVPRRGNPCLFRGFSGLLSNKQGLESQGSCDRDFLVWQRDLISTRFEPPFGNHRADRPPGRKEAHESTSPKATPEKNHPSRF